MAMLSMTEYFSKINLVLALFAVTFTAILWRIFYMQKLHPLAKFHGPWYATSFSVVGALISALRKEPQWIAHLEKKYGTEHPIRISPYMLLFSRPSALKDIYRDPQCNLKSGLYSAGALGPPSLVTVIDGDEHRALRKALSNGPWTIGPLKNTWESSFDDHIMLFIRKLREHAEARNTICLSDKLTEFAADILGMISFSVPFGSVENQRDERQLLTNFRAGLPFFGFAGRFRFLRENILPLSFVGPVLLPSSTDQVGNGWLMGKLIVKYLLARSKTPRRNLKDDQTFYNNGSPLSPIQKRGHVTLLIQAGADTTGTAMGMTIQYILDNPPVLKQVRAEIEAAESKGLLSTPIRYDEMKQHLPYMGACIKEGLRLAPPAPNLFARQVPKGGKVIDGHFIPGGSDVTVFAYTLQRNKEFYGEDAEEFKPERWLESQQRNFELEAAQFTFGAGSRVCLGKDVAILESHKLLPEIIRRFDLEVKQLGEYIVTGGVACNAGLMVRLAPRECT